MAKDFISSVVAIPSGGSPQTTSPSVISFSGDPTSGAGVAAPIASLGMRTDTPNVSFYVKTGSGNNAWTVIGFTSGSFSTLALTGNITPTSFTNGQVQNDYNPTGLSTNVVVHQGVAGPTGATLTGLNAGSQGSVVIVENTGPGPLVLTHDSGSTAANRFFLPGDMNWTLPSDGAAIFVYDTGSSRWRVLTLGTSLTTAISTDAISGTQNNYQPKISSVSVNLNNRIRQALSGNATITGLTATNVTDGFVTTLFNIDATSTITITHEDGGSTAANRFTLPNAAPVIVPPNAAISVAYDGNNSRWRPVAIPVNTANASGATVPWFGDGSDGAITCDGSSSAPGMGLSGSAYYVQRDIFASSLTVNTGITVVTQGFRLFVQGTLTLSGTANVNNNGASASGTAHGAGAPIPPPSPLPVPSPFYGGGSNGGDGSGGASNGGGGNATPAGTWIPRWNQLNIVNGGTGVGANGASNPQTPGATIGGQGGAGGGDGTHVGGAAQAGSPISSNGGGFSYISAMVGHSDNGAATWSYGIGGGGGAAAGSADRGGGGGGGGGICYVAAKAVVGSGSITATGGNGASGVSGGGAAGGGGGGGGGVVVFISVINQSTVSTSAAAGAHGAGASGGSNGGDGSPGTVVVYSLE